MYANLEKLSSLSNALQKYGVVGGCWLHWADHEENAPNKTGMRETAAHMEGSLGVWYCFMLAMLQTPVLSPESGHCSFGGPS